MQAIRFTPRRAVGLAATTALVGILSCWALAAEAGDLFRSTGLTQPVLADFAPPYAQVTQTAAYRQDQPHRIFLETLAADCGPTQGMPGAAVFSITLRRLSDPARPSNASRLVFWDGGRPHFGTMIWSPDEPRGTVRKLNFFLNALPPVGGPVVRSDGSNIDLLRDGRFSFSVHDDASVLQAHLHWKCQGAPSAAAVDNRLVPPSQSIRIDSPVAPPPAARRQQRIRAGFAFGGTGRNTLNCPPVGSLVPRSPLETDALMRQLGPRADVLCRRLNYPIGYGSVRFLSCDVDPRGMAYGFHTQTEVVCQP